MSDEDYLNSLWREAWRPPDRKPVWQWAEEHIESIPYSPMPGRFRADNSPMVREVMQEIVNPRTRLVSIIASVQSSKSTVAEVVLCYIIANMPGPTLWLDQTDDDAKDQSESRLQKLFDECPPVKALYPADKNKKRNATIHFSNGMTLWVAGAYNKSNLQRRSIRWLIGDETWRWPVGHMAEAEARVTAFGWLGKCVFLSQGGIAGDDTHRKHETTDQREWCYQCPECGEWQPFKWERIEWGKDCHNDSMPTKTLYLNVPQGKFARLTASLDVDDWGHIKVRKVDSSTTFAIDLINLLPSVEAPGPRGGHAQWSATRTIQLPPGHYEVEIGHENATYPAQYNAHYNVAVCNYDLNVDYVDLPSGHFPLHIDVKFDTRSDIGVNADEINADATGGTYCASGYVFTGIASVIYENGQVDTFSVQTGGCMAEDSPFTHPTQAQLSSDFDPTDWPDTACPPSATAIHTVRNGSVNGYSIDVPAETGRSSIKLHKAMRRGSEGCISTFDDAAWLNHNTAMAAATVAFPEDPIGFTVFYDCAQPDPYRYPN